MRKIVVLGSNSFGGASFIDYALTQGATVIGISRSSEPANPILAYANNPARSSYRFHQLDLNVDFDRIADVIKTFDPDYVVDFAGQGMVAPSWDWPEQWYTTNIVSKVKLHNHLLRLKRLRRYIRISTPEVFGPHNGVIDEDSIFNPSTPYAVSHAAIDMSLMAFYRRYDFPVSFARFANFYGECQQPYRIIPKTIICAVLKRKLPLHGGGGSTRAFIHGSDVSSGIWQVMVSGQSGRAYHFTTKEHMRINELVGFIARKVGVDPKDVIENAEDRPGKDSAYIMSYTRAHVELGWAPAVALPEGIDRCISWIKDNISFFEKEPLEYVHKK